MGVSGIGMTELLLILVVVMLLFGTKRLQSIGSDLGSAIKGFRSALNASDGEVETPKPVQARAPADPATPAGIAPVLVGAMPEQSLRENDKDGAPRQGNPAP